MAFRIAPPERQELETRARSRKTRAEDVRRARLVLTPQLEARILAWTRRKPTDGSTHWSTRRLGKALGINHMLVARAWARAGIKPHRIKRYMLSNDPEFEKKAADVIGLYINPPKHAA